MKELSEVLQDWEAVIGLEIHTELTALDTKMFCNCKLSHDDEPNANVCPVCLGLPGALPVPNKRAIESIVKAGLATNCEIQRQYDFKTEIIVAALRSAKQIVDAARMGADIVTCGLAVYQLGLEHPYTAKGLDIFRDAWDKTVTE